MLKVLDCTLRDGGYYTKWDFPIGLVNDYISVIDESGVDVIEIGFRMTPKKEFLGAFAYSTDQFLESLNLPKHSSLCVMINASEYISESEETSATLIKRYFKSKPLSPVEIVRIACHFSDLKQTPILIKTLADLGYRVGVNLMQIGVKSASEIATGIGHLRDSFKDIEVLYYADSLGNMTKNDVESINQTIKKNWEGSIGIHCHDNAGHALTNTLFAHDHGVKWLDSTITGMGRGAGNTQTEILLNELNKQNNCNFRVDDLYRLSAGEFSVLKSKYGWGYNLYYYLASEKKIHPTFIQEMLADKIYSPQQILQSISNLGQKPALSYSQNILELSLKDNNWPGTWNAQNWCEKKDILIIANGPSLATHANAIESFIEDNHLTTISININKYIDMKYIDCFAVCAPSRIATEILEYSKYGKPVFMPKSSLPSSSLDKVKKIEILDYGRHIKADTLKAEDTSCTIPYELGGAYALALCEIGKARQIFLAGFDGHNDCALRREQMEKCFQYFKESSQAIEVLSLTPSSYVNLPKGSVYSPDLINH